MLLRRRSFKLLFLLFLMLLGINCCVETEEMQDRPLVTAQIISYLPNDMHVDYADGSFESFDATKLLIISPEELENQILFSCPAKSKIPRSILNVE